MNCRGRLNWFDLGPSSYVKIGPSTRVIILTSASGKYKFSKAFMGFFGAHSLSEAPFFFDWRISAPAPAFGWRAVESTPPRPLGGGVVCQRPHSIEFGRELLDDVVILMGSEVYISERKLTPTRLAPG